MELCSDGHEEICYTEKTCPLCDALAEIEDREDQINIMEEEYDEKIDEYKLRIAELEEARSIENHGAADSSTN